MAGKWARFHDRVRFGPVSSNYQTRPFGVYSGNWIVIGPVWLRLGRRSSWEAEDQEAEMIKPVEP
jgi:hypothetical protein